METRKQYDKQRRIAHRNLLISDGIHRKKICKMTQDERMKSALEDVESKRFRVARSARCWQVTESTLRRYSRGRKPEKRGRKKRITEVEDLEIQALINDCAKNGLPLTWKELQFEIDSDALQQPKTCLSRMVLPMVGKQQRSSDRQGEKFWRRKLSS